MPKLHDWKCEMTLQLVLTERETEMIGYLAGFDPIQIADKICGGFTGRFKKEEWTALFTELRSQLEMMKTRMTDTRMVFEGRKKAVKE